MAARLLDEELDERQEGENSIEEEVSEEVHGAEEETESREIEQTQESSIPEKYQNKSLDELVRMHQEAEKLIGRQSSEVGELRTVVDQYLQTQLSPKAPQTTEDELDFFEDPERAVARAIERHPKIKEAEAISQQYRQQTALSQLQSKHPDMNNILNDQKFGEWVQASKIRTQLFAQANSQYDADAADELFSLWKERQATVQQTAAVEKSGRKQAVKSASTGNARGSAETSKKIYRRADIIKLMKTDPDRYQSLSEEIMKAYSEGRVK
jgi:hypothetical protein